MSVQLRPDEALEALQAVDPDSAARWEAILCAATTAIGAELARYYDCEAGEAEMMGAGFGGICVPMNPRRPDQPLPDGWEIFDDGAPGEWEAECERLAEAEDVCTACGRASLDCSREPCPAVIADRES